MSQINHHIELKGENGSLFITKSEMDVSKSIDFPKMENRDPGFCLNTVDKDGKFITFGLTVRMPESSSDRNSGVHKTLLKAFETMPDSNPAALLSQRRSPVYVLSDVKDTQNGYPYMEIRSNKQGFLVQVSSTDHPQHSSDPILINDPKGMALLAEMYHLAEMQQKPLTRKIREELRDGSLAQILSVENWTNAVKAEKTALEPGDEKAVEMVCFGQIKGAGIFLHKLGIPLPESIRDRWMERFGKELAKENIPSRAAAR